MSRLTRRLTLLVTGTCTAALAAGLLAAPAFVAPSSTLGALTPTVAEAAVKPKPAKKHKGIDVGNTHVGSWKVYLDAKSAKWEEGYCFQPRAGHPNSAGKATDPGVLDGMNKDQSGDVKYAVQRYGGPDVSNDTAAGLVLYIWTVQDEPSFRSALASLKRSPKLAKAAKTAEAIGREAKNRGKFTGSASVPVGVFGQTVDVTFRLRTAYNRAAYGKRLTLKGSGVAVPKTVTTGRDGVARAKVRITTTGTYKVEATHVSPASGAVLVNSPTKGNQKTVMHTGATTKITLKASNRTKAPTIKVSSDCPAPCDGIGVYRPKRTVGKGGASVRTFVYANGKTYTFDTKPGTSSGKTFRFADLTKVTTGYCSLKAGKCAHPVKKDAGTHTIECPEWPTLQASVVIGCQTCKTAATVTNPSGRTVTVWHTVAGQRGARYILKPSGSQGLTLNSTGKVNGVYFETKAGDRTIANGQLGKPGTVYAFG